MGNTHIFYHRLPALSTATLGTMAFGFALAAGTTCDFLSVSAKPGTILEYTSQNGIQVSTFESEFGVLCEHPPLFERQGDALWTMSYAFWIFSMILGCTAVVMAWLITTCVGPTYGNWRVLSLLSGIAAVTQAPIFLMVTAQPCQDHDCSISTGCIMLVISTVFWITMTMNTQCLDPPMWAHELNAWRVSQKQRGAPSRESRWHRWWKRRQWAALGISTTESESVHATSESLEKMENGSYYADSNNSRLMLKVMPDGKRPGEDQRSVNSFGTLSDFFKPADEEGQVEPIIGHQQVCAKEDESDNHLFPQQQPAMNDEPQETLVICSHEEPTMDANVAPAAAGENADRQPFLQDRESESARRCGPLCSQGMPKINGIRALAKRMKREPKPQKIGYYELDDDDGDSYADVEDECDIRILDYSLPLAHAEMEERKREVFSPVSMEAEGNEKLVNDWNTLHAAATAGIMLPRTISIKENGELEVPELGSQSLDGSQSEVSLPSFTEHPDDEAEGYMSGSTLSSGDSDDSSSHLNRSRQQGRRQQFSCGNSVASRRSLLELTIQEETEGDLSDSASSGNKNGRGLSTDYQLRAVKSAPDAMGLVMPVSPYELKESKSTPVQPVDSHSTSEDSESSYVLRKTSGVTRIAPVSETIDAEPNPAENEAQKDSWNCLETVTGPLRSRSRTCKKVSPEPLTMVESTLIPESPNFRGERLDKAGIHFSHINVVSDDSSDDDESNASNRSARSTVSRRARNARIRRLRADKDRRRRSRSLDDPSKKRKEMKIVFDPMLRAILVTREAGVEYGPDEASL